MGRQNNMMGGQRGMGQQQNNMMGGQGGGMNNALQAMGSQGMGQQSRGGPGSGNTSQGTLGQQGGFQQQNMWGMVPGNNNNMMGGMQQQQNNNKLTNFIFKAMFSKKIFFFIKMGI